MGAYEELMTWFVGESEKKILLEKDFIKASQGNKTAGRRVRKYMQQIRQDAKQVRVEVMGFIRRAEELKAQRKAEANA